jgi:hypothetical protein
MTTATSITVRVPLKFRRRSGRKSVVTPVVDGMLPVTTRADPALVKALARAFRYQRLLDEGRYASISEMAEGEKIERGYPGEGGTSDREASGGAVLRGVVQTRSWRRFQMVFPNTAFRAGSHPQ